MSAWLVDKAHIDMLTGVIGIACAVSIPALVHARKGIQQMRTAVIPVRVVETLERQRYTPDHPPVVELVQKYLPQNYRASQAKDGSIVITGKDVAGWTMEEYVIPRLASGLIFAEAVP